MAPVQPKKPVGGAYGVFLAENREKFTKATAGQRASAVSKLAGAEWKKTTAAEKEVFEKKYKDIKAKFDKDMEAFLAAGGVKEKGARGKAKERKEKGAKKERDPNMPKKPGFGAFGLYVNENRAAIKAKLSSSATGPAVNKQAKLQWEALADKTPWEAKFKKAQEEYKKAMEKYKADKAAAGDEDEDEEDEEDEDDEEEEEKKPAAKKTKKA